MMNRGLSIKGRLQHCEAKDRTVSEFFGENGEFGELYEIFNVILCSQFANFHKKCHLNRAAYALLRKLPRKGLTEANPFYPNTTGGGEGYPVQKKEKK